MHDVFLVGYLFSGPRQSRSSSVFPHQAVANARHRRGYRGGQGTAPTSDGQRGQYLFRLAELNTTRKVVQVLSADGMKPYCMFFALPAERFEAASTPEVRGHQPSR